VGASGINVTNRRFSLTAAEKQKRNNNMATTELPLSTDPAAKSSDFIFDVALSTEIAANGKT
jgi:hypothetical protein